MEDIKYYVVYAPSDNDIIYVSTNLENVKKDTEESGSDYIEVPFYN